VHFAPSVGDVGGDAKEPYPQIFDLSVPKTGFQQFIEIAAAEIGQDRERQRPQVVRDGPHLFQKDFRNQLLVGGGQSGRIPRKRLNCISQ
jgi:hypothetical protein